MSSGISSGNACVACAADVKPLPSLMVPDVAKNPLDDNKPKLARKEVRVDTDDEFLAKFEAKGLDRWSHESLLRVIW